MSMTITGFSDMQLFVHRANRCRSNNHYLITADKRYPQRLDGKKEGCYICHGKADVFYVGSAPYFSFWRDILACVFYERYLITRDKKPTEEIVRSGERYLEQHFRSSRPFLTLLFKGYNGSIGPKTSRELAQEFALNAGIFKGRLPGVLKRWGKVVRQQNRGWHLDEQGCIEFYARLQQVFELASQNGFVTFCS